MTTMRITPSRAFLIGSALVFTSLAGVRASTFAEAPADSRTPAANRRPRNRPLNRRRTPEQPIFRAGINTVRVDVIVTDRQGNPVTDLKLEDFEIQEDGKPQKPETFRLIKIDTETQPAYTQRGSARATTKRPRPPTRIRASSRSSSTTTTSCARAACRCASR